MKKVIKYFFIILLSLVILFIITAFVFLVVLVKRDGDEADKVAALSDTTMTQIMTYYQNNGSYPKSLQNIPIHNSKEFIQNQKKQQFYYHSYGENRSKYIFSWIGGAMNWSGYNCTNDKSRFTKKVDGLVMVYPMPNGTLCRIIDLH
jgi:hypothetical protein